MTLRSKSPAYREVDLNCGDITQEEVEQRDKKGGNIKEVKKEML